MCDYSKIMAAVGFELEPRLRRDWCLKLPIDLARHIGSAYEINYAINAIRHRPLPDNKKIGSGGIRTHASEETDALNQRLRPLTYHQFSPLMARSGSAEKRYGCVEGVRAFNTSVRTICTIPYFVSCFF